MITLFFVVNQLRSSGPIKVLFDICCNLDKTQYDIRIISLMKDEGIKSMANIFSEIGVEIVNYNYSFAELEFQTGKVARRIVSLVESAMNPILHAHGYHPTLVLSKIRTIPTVTTIHSISDEDYVRSKGHILGRYMSFRFKRSLQHIIFPVAISSYMKRYYEHCNPKIQVIYNGVHYKRGMVNKEEVCNLLGISSDKLIVLVTGHLSKLKNPYYIVRELKASKKDFICIFVGNGSELRKCQILADGDSRFYFAGYVTNVNDYLSVADIFVSASYTEGMPLAVLEALNMGVPSLISDIPAHSEIAGIMNIAGVRTYSLRPEELAKQFDSFSSELFNRSLIGDRANAIFSASSMAERYSLLYISIYSQYAK